MYLFTLYFNSQKYIFILYFAQHHPMPHILIIVYTTALCVTTLYVTCTCTLYTISYLSAAYCTCCTSYIHMPDYILTTIVQCDSFYCSTHCSSNLYVPCFKIALNACKTLRNSISLCLCVENITIIYMDL